MTTRNPGNLDELLSALLDDQISDAEREQVQRLLAADPTVRARIEALRRTVRLVQSLPRRQAPPALLDDLTAQIERRMLIDNTGSSVSPASRKPRSLISLLATAALLAISVGGAAWIVTRVARYGTPHAAAPPIARTQEVGQSQALLRNLSAAAKQYAMGPPRAPTEAEPSPGQPERGSIPGGPTAPGGPAFQPVTDGLRISPDRQAEEAAAPQPASSIPAPALAERVELRQPPAVDRLDAMVRAVEPGGDAAPRPASPDSRPAPAPHKNEPAAESPTFAASATRDADGISDIGVSVDRSIRRSAESYGVPPAQPPALPVLDVDCLTDASCQAIGEQLAQFLADRGLVAYWRTPAPPADIGASPPPPLAGHRTGERDRESPASEWMVAVPSEDLAALVDSLASTGDSNLISLRVGPLAAESPARVKQLLAFASPGLFGSAGASAASQPLADSETRDRHAPPVPDAGQSEPPQLCGGPHRHAIPTADASQSQQGSATTAPTQSHELKRRERSGVSPASATKESWPGRAASQPAPPHLLLGQRDAQGVPTSQSWPDHDANRITLLIRFWPARQPVEAARDGQTDVGSTEAE